MPEWREVVQKHLVGLGLSSSVEKDVVAELAAHLEDDYEQGIESGMGGSDAEKHALARIPWHRLARKIYTAKVNASDSGGNAKNQRSKKWLPALTCLSVTAVLLVIFEKIHARPLMVELGHFAMALQLAWLAAMPLIGKTDVEECLMNRRTRSIWLPGFVSLTAASLLMFAEEIVLQHDPSFYFTNISLHPREMIFGLPRWFYVLWLLMQVPCGAVGAFLSRRGGGTCAARIVAGAFPALAIFLLCGLAIPVSALFEPNSFVLHHPNTVAFGILVWGGAPAITLLMGAAPFLRRSPQPVV